MPGLGTNIFFLCFGFVAGIMCAVVTYQHFGLRRQLKAAQKALEAREPAPQVLASPTKAESYRQFGYDKPPQPREEPRFSGIGPSDIASRELYEREKERRDSTPKFASPHTLNPSIAEIEAAAREATGGKPN